jgi:hypothetical protein
MFKSGLPRCKKTMIAAVAFHALAGATISQAALLSPNAPVHSSGPFISLVPGGVNNPSAVNAGDTFDIVVVGFNASNSGAYMTGPVDPVFNTTQTYSGDALAGQVLSVTSSEVVGPTTTTDTFTISVPTNFDPTGTTIDGIPVTFMEADLGGYNAGTDTVDFSSPLASATPAGSILYGGGSTDTLLPFETFSNGGSSLAMTAGVAAGGSDLAAFAINSFTLSVTYANPVPEPASAGLLLCMAIGLRKRRRA